MKSLKNLQLQALHGLMGVEDFLEFRELLYKTLIVSKYQKLVEGLDGNEVLGLSQKECMLVETCLELLKFQEVTEEFVVEKTFYLLKSLCLHFQVLGLQESVQISGRSGLEQDKTYQAFIEDDLISHINVHKTFFNNLKTFEALFARQQKPLVQYCQNSYPECYELISGFCEG